MFECSIDPEDPEANILKEAPKEYVPQAVVGLVAGKPEQVRNSPNVLFNPIGAASGFRMLLIVGLEIRTVNISDTIDILAASGV